MTLMSSVWMVIGAATGAGHATALWRTAHRTGRADWGFPWRVPVVLVTLVVAALVGRLLPAAIGWAVGLVITGVILLASRRWR